MYKKPWASLKNANINSPDDFMIYLVSIVPNLSENDIIQVRRQNKHVLWIQKVCDFIWLCMKPDKEKWAGHIDMFWSEIKNIMAEQRLEDAFSGLSI
jgi:hypothetical protein